MILVKYGPTSSDVHVDEPMGEDGKPKRKKKPTVILDGPGSVLDKDAARSLFVKRTLLNADELRTWAKAQGFASALPPGDMHVTLAFSKQKLDWSAIPDSDDELEVQVEGHLERLGDKGAVVLRFDSPDLHARWQELRGLGAVWSFPTYRPHVTLTYEPGQVDVESAAPFVGVLRFGPEQFKEVRENWFDAVVETPLSKAEPIRCEVVKIDEEQRMVYGWASIITVDGQVVEDLQGDMMAPDVLEKAATEFMKEVRTHAVGHERDGEGGVVQKGDVVHSFPLTYALAKLLGIQTRFEGWLIGAFVKDDAAWAAYKSGELKAFSIAGEMEFRDAA